MDGYCCCIWWLLLLPLRLFHSNCLHTTKCVRHQQCSEHTARFAHVARFFSVFGLQRNEHSMHHTAWWMMAMGKMLTARNSRSSNNGSIWFRRAGRCWRWVTCSTQPMEAAASFAVADVRCCCCCCHCCVVYCVPIGPCASAHQLQTNITNVIRAHRVLLLLLLHVRYRKVLCLRQQQKHQSNAKREKEKSRNQVRCTTIGAAICLSLAVCGPYRLRFLLAWHK